MKIVATALILSLGVLSYNNNGQRNNDETNINKQETKINTNHKNYYNYELLSEITSVSKEDLIKEATESKLSVGGLALKYGVLDEYKEAKLNYLKQNNGNEIQIENIINCDGSASNMNNQTNHYGSGSGKSDGTGSSNHEGRGSGHMNQK